MINVMMMSMRSPLGGIYGSSEGESRPRISEYTAIYAATVPRAVSIAAISQAGTYTERRATVVELG